LQVLPSLSSQSGDDKHAGIGTSEFAEPLANRLPALNHISRFSNL
jgi:hypothetical protein